MVANGSVTREFRLGSFAAIADFVRDVITSSDRLDHHPDLDIRYPDRVTVRLTTHAIGGLSTLDADLADISKSHTRFDVTLPADTTGTYAGFVRFLAPAKGNYLRSVTISSTMGPGYKLDTSKLQAVAE